MSTDRFTRAAFPALRVGADPAGDRAAARGFARGHAEGFRTARAEVEAAAAAHRRQCEQQDAAAEQARASAMAALGAAATAFDRQAEQVATLTEQRVLQYALELAELILGAELEDASHAAARVVRQAVAAAGGDPVRRVRVHPRDLEQLRTAPAASAAAPASVEFVADDGLEPGDAVIEHDEGWVDARVRSALTRARDALDEAAP